MKTISKYLLGFAAILALTGCKDKMVELNTNPETLTASDPRQIFFNATAEFGYVDRGRPLSIANGVMRFMQYTAGYSMGSPVNNAGLYQRKDSDPNGNNFVYGFWGAYFNSYGRQLNYLVYYIDNIVQEVERPRYQEIRAVSTIIQTYLAWRCVDVYGAMPYKEGLKAISDGITLPKYDMYEELYTIFEDTLRKQVELLKQAAPVGNVSLGQYDGFYGVKVTTPGIGASGGPTYSVRDAAEARKMWIKAANALRIKIAYRVLRKDPNFFQTVLTSVTSDPQYLMSDYMDGLYYTSRRDLPESRDDSNTLSSIFNASAAFVNAMKQDNDPRLPLLVRPNTHSDQSSMVVGSYSGGSFPAGADVPSASSQAYTHNNQTWCEPSVTGGAAQNACRQGSGWVAMKYNCPDTLFSYGNQFAEGNMFIGVTMNPSAGENFSSNDPTVGGGPHKHGRSLGSNIARMHIPKAASVAITDKRPNIRITNPYSTSPLTNCGTMTPSGNTGGSLASTYQGVYVSAGSLIYGSYHFKTNTFCYYSGSEFWGEGGNPKWDQYNIRAEVISYADFCFTMALIANEFGGTPGGKDAETWYKNGIDGSIKALYALAQNAYISSVANDKYISIPGITADGVGYFDPVTQTLKPGANKRLYVITQAMIDTYIAANPITKYDGNPLPYTDWSSATIAARTEAIMEQVWMAMFLQPEEMWAYWKLTGYPRHADFPMFSNNTFTFTGGTITMPDGTTQTYGDGNTYPEDVALEFPTRKVMETPYYNSPNYETASEELWYRRCQFPAASTTEMGPNRDEAFNKLLAQPNYGTVNAETTGCIWWDTKWNAQTVSVKDWNL